MRTKLLLKFADWLEQNIKPESFDFSKVVSRFDEEHNCGTVCCAIGWLPLFDEEVTKTGQVKWQNETCNDYLSVTDNPSHAEDFLYYDKAAAKYFDMDMYDANRLFAPETQHNIKGWDIDRLEADATPAEVANAIRYYVEIKS